MALLSKYQVCQWLDDELVWKGHSSGSFSTKSFCIHLANGNASKRWSMIWSSLLPPKVEAFCWQVFHVKVAIKENLAVKGVLRDIIKIRIDLWANDNCSKVNVQDVFRDPSVVSIKRDKGSGRKLAKWTRPKDGTVKFNVDKSSRGKPSPTGIGGLLRDHTGKELIRFYKATEDSNFAKYLVIWEALLIFISFFWAYNKKLCGERFDECSPMGV
ncbi:hypothetical protein PTKIN_Ptkin08bG0188300 [Pterospermum kingtungense]